MWAATQGRPSVASLCVILLQQSAESHGGLSTGGIGGRSQIVIAAVHDLVIHGPGHGVLGIVGDVSVVCEALHGGIPGVGELPPHI